MTPEPREITTRDILLGLVRKVDDLSREMADVKILASTIGSNVTTLLDHETRLRALERFRYGFPGLALIATVVSVGTLVYAVFFGNH